ncbi:hypothetical protein, conserved [Leishmania tarentolae]|uniref:Uncharacterized protein n=1 Tax=Leishmania tarentolae TaxID=5689 RepID=A0A640KQQ3_LEITA|nr:hypothetical protein, conserved [Leishmania tarentolae]
MTTRHTQVACLTVAIGGLLGVCSYILYKQVRQKRAGSPNRKVHAPSSPVKPPAAASGAQASPPLPQAPISVPVEAPYPEADKAKALQLLNVLKQNANIAFREGRYEDALRGYQDCLEVTSALGAADTDAVATEQIVRANVVMVCIRMHEYDSARAVATMLLQDAAIALPDDLKVKVLYRRGLASKALNDRDAALADFKAAVHFSKDNSNPAVEQEIALLQRCAA